MRKVLIIAALLPLVAWGQGWKAHSELSQGQWYRLSVAETGVYQLTLADIPTLDGVDISRIALYGGDARQMDEDNLTPESDDLQPYACHIDDRNSNGRFDGNDRLLFFAEGATTWRYSTEAQCYTHQRHAYSNHNYLYLRIDSPTARRIPTLEPPAANLPDVNTFTLCGLYEQELVNTHNSGQIWVGEKFLNGNSKSVTVSMPSASGALHTRIGLAVPEAAGQFRISQGGTHHDFSLNSREDYKVVVADFNGGAAPFTLDFSAAGSTAGYLDFIEINTTQEASYSAGCLMVYASDTAIGYAQHRLVRNGLSPWVWDVTRPDSTMAMTTRQEGAYTTFVNATNRRRTYAVFAPDQALTPVSISALNNQDLHGAASPDMVIVCHQQFVEQAQRLANLHNILDGLEVLVVAQEQVFNEFSSGKKDPIAIREMMRMFHHRSDRKPRYLLLFGKGTYDNRDILTLGLPSVVTYQSPTSFSTESFCSVSDDIYGYLHDDEQTMSGSGLDLGIGRLPVKSVAEANLMLDKIERYMMRSDLEQSDMRGDWRTYVALLSDDADPSQAADIDFAISSEYLAQTIERQAPWINLDKIYADSYPQQSGTIGSYYPDVNNALKQRMDYGCLLLNYIGHGADQYIGTERYMELTDIDNYKNYNSLPFFVTSTCSFGKFDKLDGSCGSEVFVLAPGAGVGCVAAARPISHIRNFNTCLSSQCLMPENTVGDALRIAKNRYPMAQNRAITLMGDPALRLSFPEHRVVVTAINGHAVVEGVADSAEVLSRVTVEGEIRNAAGLVQSDFNGIIYPTVFDRKTDCRTLANDNEGTEVDFTPQKNVLSKGRDTVVNGRFAYSFIVPRDVAFRYDSCKMSHYAKADGSDAAGAHLGLLLGGFDENADISETHPSIRLFIGDTTFLSGGMADEKATLWAILFDSVGINSVGSGLGHDITAMLDGNANDLIVLNDFYEPDVNNPKVGHICYQFEQLTPGRHTLTLKAWNIYNYSASASVEFVVRGSDSISLDRLTAYPNPTQHNITLQVGHNCPYGMESARIDIYDMRGRCIRTYHLEPQEGSYTIGPVDCNLDEVPDGIYLARVIATTQAGETLTATTKIIKKK